MIQPQNGYDREKTIDSVSRLWYTKCVAKPLVRPIFCIIYGKGAYIMENVMLPVGIEFFDEIRTEGYYYVDKTGLICELLRNRAKVSLFTRPRRFGKTLTMSMLKSFFQIGNDSSLFEGLEIMREKQLCEQYMGKYPVIFITLKDVEGLDFESAKRSFKTAIGDEAGRFRFLLGSVKLDEEDKNSYKKLIEIAKDNDELYAMPDAALEGSLKILSRLLYKHYGKKAILLVDEYDVPLDKAFAADYYDEMVSLVRNVLGNALKTNEYLQMAVLTGCLRISRESIFTGLNNLKVHTVSDERFGAFFGFTDFEVAEMLEYYGLSSHKELVREWYDGYRFGNSGVYCPWDVINYCDDLSYNLNAEPINYWANTSGNDLVLRLLDKSDLQTRKDIERLVNGESITKTVREELDYRDIEASVENVWSVLYAAGYLTCRKRLPDGQMELILPNGEMRSLFFRLADNWYRKKMISDNDKAGRFCGLFLLGDASAIQEMLGDYLWDCISVRDTAAKNMMKENFYHGLLLGLLRSRGDWELKSNAEAGEGYSDISIETRGGTGIIIEIKYAHDGNLKSACEDALQQIEEKNYAKTLEQEGMEKIIKYGIAFFRKRCQVVCISPA